MTKEGKFLIMDGEMRSRSDGRNFNDRKLLNMGKCRKNSRT